MLEALEMTNSPVSTLQSRADREPIDVVHLVRRLDVGGLEMVVFDLVRCSRRAGVSPTVLCLEEAGTLAPRFEAAGIPVQSLNASGVGSFRRVLRLSSALRRLRPDVLHTHNAGPHFNGALARILTRIPVLIHTKHGRNYPGDSSLVRKTRWASALSSAIVPVSSDAANVVTEVERVSSPRVRLIRNGIDTSRFTPPALPRIGRTNKAVHVARLNPVKDQVTLLRAARLVADCLPDFELHIVGDGPHRVVVEEEIRNLELGSVVRLHGMQDDVLHFLWEADFFVLSSISEGISLTLLEAMATGLPVVATRVGGNAEVVDEGTGTLVPSGDPEAMAEAIIGFCTDAERTRTMGLRARERVESEFSLNSMVSCYSGLYRELLSRRRRRGRTKSV